MVVALCSTETLVFIECSGLGTINLSSIINVQQEERNVECERKVLLYCFHVYLFHMLKLLVIKRIPYLTSYCFINESHRVFRFMYKK